jgi:hypothetical protein
MWGGRWRWWALLVVGVLALSGSRPAVAQAEARVFVGRVTGAEGLDALVAVVVDPDGKAAVYLCSKDDAWNRQYSKWFEGTVGPDGRLLARAGDGTELTAVVQDRRAEGTVSGLRWTADLITEGTAGLYWGRVGEDLHVVIEAPDGTRVGRVWSVATGAHVGTWDFSVARVEHQAGVMHVQPGNQPISIGEQVFLQLFFCSEVACRS